MFYPTISAFFEAEGDYEENREVCGHLWQPGTEAGHWICSECGDNARECIHCGQAVNQTTGLDVWGSAVCGSHAADDDMRDELHDVDLGPVEEDPCCLLYKEPYGLDHEYDCPKAIKSRTFIQETRA